MYKNDNTQTQVKKNTYVTKLDGILMDIGLFEFCKGTPLPVVTINGKSPNTVNSNWLRAKTFANPYAQEMARLPKDFTQYAGKLASTIIEYLDKDTNEPVAHLFPTSQLSFKNAKYLYLERLDDATFRDLKHEIDRRRMLITMYNKTQTK